MSDNPRATPDRHTRLENFAAELTSAVYAVLLRRGLNGSWVRVELTLWRALTETADEWARERPPAASPGELDAWRAGFLAALTTRAVSIARNNGIEGPLGELEPHMSEAFHLVLGKYSPG
jgi:hypothetical protein